MTVPREPGFISAEPHRTAQVGICAALLQPLGAHPLGDDPDHWLVGRTEFGRAGRRDPGSIARSFDAGHLHTQTDPEERDIAFTREADRGDLAFGAAHPEPAGHEDAVHRLEPRNDLVVAGLECFGIDPADVDLDPVGHAAVRQRLVEALVGIGQADILAHHPDRHFAFGVMKTIDDIIPAGQIRRRCRQSEMVQHLGVETLGMVLQRDRVDTAGVERGNDRFLAHVAEQRDLVALVLGQGMLAAAQQEVGLDAQAGQFAHRVLGRLGLELARRRHIGHQGHVDRTGPLTPQFVAQLAQRFDKRQAFDIADRPADLAQYEIQPVGVGLGKFLDRVGDVRNDLHGGAKIITAAFTDDDVAVDAARSDVVRLPR